MEKIFNLFIVFLIVPNVLTARRSGLISGSIGSSPIVFPNSQRHPNAQNSFDSALIRTAGLRNASRRKNNIAEQAVCEPELRTVEVGDQGVEAGEIFFPKCVRVLRCGGCCDISDRMACTPTKISYREVKRAKIRIRRSATPSATSQSIPIEVHEECRCMCKVKEEHCNSSIHVYQKDLCKCACKNEQEFAACRNMAPLKTWENSECKCKCREVKHCPSGTVFSHDTCNCEAT
ncbi:vascular endothelial growth factor A-like isoform X2 [Panonychus citri]|uniref:vascular endothelial growth factor A-like isoform X2 n=1 Tax=Panonychus citri TaxID=50023 RepID=UPI002307486B|nr:vascular endothelial growth factor A-like isoform X2 [Panonychus citri]